MSEDLPYGQSGIRRLPVCIRCAPAFCQSSSIHNSLRSIKLIAVWRLSSFSPGKFCELRDFAYGQNLCVLYAKFPPPKAKRLQLLIVIEVFPFMDTSLMDGELHLLASGTGEYWIRFGLEITFSVNMEECDVSDGGIAIRKEEAWFVFRHSLEV